jgi:hypothetical protein
LTSFHMPLTPLDFFYTQSHQCIQDDARKNDECGDFFSVHRTSPPRPSRSSGSLRHHQMSFFRVLSA